MYALPILRPESMRRWKTHLAVLLIFAWGIGWSNLHFSPTMYAEEKDRPIYHSSHRILNFHRHCANASEELIAAELAAMDEVGIDQVVILDGGKRPTKKVDGKVTEVGEDNLAEWMALKKKYPDRLIIFSYTDFSRIQRKSFFEDLVSELTYRHKLGIQGVKIGKELGLLVREESGKLLKGDDKRLDPYWAKCGELGLPVLIHMADPPDFFAPLTSNSVYYGRMNEKNAWYKIPDAPNFDELIQQRDHILAKHPHTKFIGAHMGSLESDLKRLGETLDKYPNFYVDFSARLNVLGRLNPTTVRDFFTKYRDRVIFGTDSSIGRRKDEGALRFFSRYLEYCETDRTDILDPYARPDDRQFLSGVKLRDELLEDFYYNNGAKLIPGFKPRGK